MRLAPLSERLYILQVHCGRCTIQWNQSNAIYVCSLSHGHYTLGVDDRRIDLRMLLQSSFFHSDRVPRTEYPRYTTTRRTPSNHAVQEEQLLIRRLVMTNRRQYSAQGNAPTGHRRIKRLLCIQTVKRCTLVSFHNNYFQMLCL